MGASHLWGSSAPNGSKCDFEGFRPFLGATVALAANPRKSRARSDAHGRQSNGRQSRKNAKATFVAGGQVDYAEKLWHKLSGFFGMLPSNSSQTCKKKRVDARVVGMAP